MIIAVQGTLYGNNEAVKVVNALAVMGVATDQLTTMILQFTNKTRKSAEQYLIGKTLRNESLVQDASVPDISSGMDALCAHVLGQDDNAKFFSEVSRSLVLQKDRNLFDVVSVSRKESFEKEILNKQRKPTIKNEDFVPELQDKDYLEHLLDAIDDVYKVVYVLMPSKNQALSQEILKYADINIICLHQGNAEPVTHGGKREFYVITDYCNGSAYSTKAVAQMYGQKMVYTCMHNIQYNDACANGTALDYLKENLKTDKNSAAHSFISNIETLYNALMRKTGRKTAEANPDELLVKYEGPRLMQVQWSPITESVVREVVTTGTFKKTTSSYAKLVPNENASAIPTEYWPQEAEAVQENNANAFDLDDMMPASKPEPDKKPGRNIPEPILTQDDNSFGFEDLEISSTVTPDASPVYEEPATLEDIQISEPMPQTTYVPQPEPVQEEPAPAPKKKGLFSALFGKKEKKPMPRHMDGELPQPVNDMPPQSDDIYNDMPLADEEDNEFADEPLLDDAFIEEAEPEQPIQKTPQIDMVIPEFDDSLETVSKPVKKTRVKAKKTAPLDDIEIPELDEPAIQADAEQRTALPEAEPVAEEAPVKKAKTTRTRKPRAKKTEDDLGINMEPVAETAGVSATITPELPKPVKKSRKKKSEDDGAGASDTTKTDDGWVIG